MRKTNLEVINENLPLIPKDTPTDEKIKLVKKKKKFVDDNAGLFQTASQYIMTCQSVQMELKSLIGCGRDIEAPFDSEHPEKGGDIVKCCKTWKCQECSLLCKNHWGDVNQKSNEAKK